MPADLFSDPALLNDVVNGIRLSYRGEWEETKEILLDTMAHFPQLQAEQDARIRKQGPKNVRNPYQCYLPDVALWQKTVHWTLRRPEIAQEAGTFELQQATGLPCRPPSIEEMHVRFIRTHLASTMDRRTHFALIAAKGAYCYPLHQVYPLTAWANTRKAHARFRQAKKSLLEDVILKQFPTLQVVEEDRGETWVRLQEPTAAAWRVVHEALIQYAVRLEAPHAGQLGGGCPTLPPHTPLTDFVAQPPYTPHAPRDIDYARWLQQIHVITCPRCAGASALVRAWNADQYERNGTMPLADPDKRRGVPDFAGLSTTPGGLPPHSSSPEAPPEVQGIDRAWSAPLSPEEKQDLYNAWVRMQTRRQQFHAERWTVYLDGRPAAQMAPAHASRRTTLRVSAQTEFMQVYGHDAAGDILLGASFVPDELREKATGHLAVTLRLSATGDLEIAYPKGAFQRLRSWCHEAMTAGKRWFPEQLPGVEPLPVWAAIRSLCQGQSRLAPDWHLWIETVAGEVLEAIAPTQSWFLPAVCRTPFQRPVLWWLPRWGSSLYFRHPVRTGRSKMSAVLAILEETTHRLQAFHPGASPTAVAHRLTPAQRAEVSAHIRSAVRRRHLSETEARCLEETVARYLSGANASGGGLV